jgi:hypothetical protein
MKTNLSSAVKAEEETLSSDSKRSMMNEESKQMTQMKTFHNFSTSESTSSSEIARIVVDEEGRQAEVTEKSLNQLHSKQKSNRNLISYIRSRNRIKKFD